MRRLAPSKDDDGGERKTFFRCGICDLNWPLIEAYRRCPKCKTPTGKFTSFDHVMSEEEAIRLAHAFAFEEYCENETLEEREIRHQASREQRERFEMVIANGGFSTSDRRRIRELEARLAKE